MHGASSHMRGQLLFNVLHSLLPFKLLQLLACHSHFPGGRLALPLHLVLLGMLGALHRTLVHCQTVNDQSLMVLRAVLPYLRVLNRRRHQFKLVVGHLHHVLLEFITIFTGGILPPDVLLARLL